MKKRGQKSDYRITVDGNRRIITIHYLVPMTTAIALESGPELMRVANENNIRKFLFDMRESTNIQSVAHNYFFANKDIQTFSFPRNSISAFLVHPSDHSHDFVTTAFMNAGYQVAKFVNEEEALQWLDSDGN